MEDHNPAIRLFKLIKSNSDEQTAHDAISGIQGLVKGEVKAEITHPVSALEVKLVERINHVEVKLEEKINGVELRLIERINNVEFKLGERLNRLDVRINDVELRVGERISRLEVKLGEFKVDMIDRINISKNQTIFWIVGIGVLQLVVRYLFKE